MSEKENFGKVAGMTPEDFEDIDDDGAVADPYQGIDTYWCPLEMVGETDTFLRVIGDNGGTNVEIRVPLEQMRNNGWTPPNESVLKRSTREERIERLECDNAALLAACKALVKAGDNRDQTGFHAAMGAIDAAIEQAEASQ